MGIQKEHHQLLAKFTTEYDLQPIASRLSTIIKESLANNPSIKCREGTILVPNECHLVCSSLYYPP